MKRSITCAGWTLGSAALIALGLGCSKPRPPEAPTTEGTSPTFESNVPGSPAPGVGEQAVPPAPPPPPGAGAPPPPPPAPGGEMGAPPGAGPQGEPPGPAAGMNEKQICDAMASDAKLKVEDVQNGVAIVLTPRQGRDVSSIRDDVRKAEDVMKQHRAASAPGPETCGLFSIARLPSVSSTVSEGASSVRIVLTTTNAAEVKDLRRITRDQVGSMVKAHGGKR